MPISTYVWVLDSWSDRRHLKVWPWTDIFHHFLTVNKGTIWQIVILQELQFIHLESGCSSSKVQTSFFPAMFSCSSWGILRPNEIYGIISPAKTYNGRHPGGTLIRCQIWSVYAEWKRLTHSSSWQLCTAVLEVALWVATAVKGWWAGVTLASPYCSQSLVFLS